MSELRWSSYSGEDGSTYLRCVETAPFTVDDVWYDPKASKRTLHVRPMIQMRVDYSDLDDPLDYWTGSTSAWRWDPEVVVDEERYLRTGLYLG